MIAQLERSSIYKLTYAEKSYFSNFYYTSIKFVNFTVIFIQKLSQQFDWISEMKNWSWFNDVWEASRKSDGNFFYSVCLFQVTRNFDNFIISIKRKSVWFLSLRFTIGNWFNDSSLTYVHKRLVLNPDFANKNSVLKRTSTATASKKLNHSRFFRI